MKKLLAIMLSLVMMFAMTSVAFAEGTDKNHSDSGNTVYITKDYELTGTGINPAETFEIENLIASKVENAADGVTAGTMPMISIGTVEFAEGALNNINADPSVTKTSNKIAVTLPGCNPNPSELPVKGEDGRYDVFPSVGVYTYTFNEKNNGTAGVEYYGKTMKVVVTVIMSEEGLLRVAAVHCESEGENKASSFTNTYSAGTLKVSKTVAGNMGDNSQKFHFTIKLTAPSEQTVKSDIYSNAKVYDAGEGWTEKTIEVDLAHGEELELSNIPHDVTYTVTETAVDGYTASYVHDGAASVTGTSVDGTVGGEHTVAFTNTKTGEVDTGISLDSMPYILMLSIAGIGMVTVMARKRREA